MEIYEIDDVVEQVRKSREPDYKTMWEELKRRLGVRFRHWKNREAEEIDKGNDELAEAYCDWAIETNSIISMMHNIEREFTHS